MLEESKEVNPTSFDPKNLKGSSNKESLSSLLSSGEVRARITGVRKVIVNYETYIAYQIQTVANRGDYPSGICVVERRYREFDWLYNRFLSIYAVVFVPPLPGKKVLSQINRYASGFVDRRCSGLQTFLHKSASHSILSSNPDFIAFLTLSRNDFQRYKERYPTESSLISSLIGHSPQVLASDSYIGTAGISEQQSVNAVDTNPPSDFSSPSSNTVVTKATGVVPSPQQLVQASEKFTRYQIEDILILRSQSCYNFFVPLCDPNPYCRVQTSYSILYSYLRASLPKYVLTDSLGICLPVQFSVRFSVPSSRILAVAMRENMIVTQLLTIVSHVMEYTALCQSLSSLVDRMTTQLATLSYDHAELAKTLEQAGQSSVVTASAATTNPEGGWASALVGSAMRQTAQATHTLASRLSDDSARAWHENAAFGEAVKRVLKNRQTIQDSYFSLDREFKERRRIEAAASENVIYQHPQAPTSTDASTVSTGDTQINSTSHKWLTRFTSMPWGSNSKRKKNSPISELEAKLKSACCDLVFANSQVEAEWQQWQSERVKETAESLSTLASAYVAYWSSLADAWRDVNILLNDSSQIANDLGNVVATDLSVDATPAAAELTKDNLLKLNSVESTSHNKHSLNEADLSSSSKDTLRNLEDQKEREWTVVDLSDSPCVEKKLESMATEYG
nr:sorting nexin [Hymenolepis microstoma]